jgi:hypothetical protein
MNVDAIFKATLSFRIPYSLDYFVVGKESDFGGGREPRDTYILNDLFNFPA